jgi:carbon-monoxide dehydrogenase medium subunit
MWTSEFQYERPQSLAEALQRLSEQDDAKLLAGGHSLLPAMKLRLADYGTLIDIGRLTELKGINRHNGGIRIGALSTHAEISDSELVRAACPALAAATGLVGDVQVRNWGTIGGNLAHSDPASDPTTAVLACDGIINVQSRAGSRSIAASDYFVDLFTVDLEPGEIITSIDLPDLSAHDSAYIKMAHPASRYAVVGVCVVLEMNGANCVNARVAVGGATIKPVRSSGAEASLAGTSLDEASLDAAADALRADIADDLIGDVSFPESYRQQIAGVYLKRAIRAATE